MFELVPALDEVWLARYRAAEERGERFAALGQIFWGCPGPDGNVGVRPYTPARSYTNLNEE